MYSTSALSAVEEAALYFNQDFLRFSDGDKASYPDLSYFSHSDGILPGNYIVNIVVNGKPRGAMDISFVRKNTGRVRPLLTRSLLDKLGVSISEISHSTDDNEIKKILPDSNIKFDSRNQVLYIDIPQKWMASPPWLRTPPESWNDGIPALLVNYRYSSSQQRSSGIKNSNDNLSINSGLNIGGWRIRHDGFFYNPSEKISIEHSWQSLNTWAQHDYSFGQGGELIIGQTSTDGTIFESFPFEGIELVSDDGMINPWLSSFSPVIKGIAYSQAQIFIRQNNRVIWQGSVPAGAFEIKDVNPLFSGDMDVEVHESDGSIRHFSQSSASIPVLQREGRLRYSATFGRYRSGGNEVQVHEVEQPLFMQAAAAWGMDSAITLYGGFMHADNYRSFMFGVGKYHDLFGAFSVDATHSISEFSHELYRGDKSHGLSLRALWSRGFDTTGTQINVSSYLYNSQEYYSFNELQQLQSTDEDFYKLRNRISTQIMQNATSIGQLSLNADWFQYWLNNKQGWQTRLNWGYLLGSVSSNISLSYAKQPEYEKPDKSFYVSFSVPFGTFSNYESASLTSSLFSNNGKTIVQGGINGTLFDQHLSYSLMEGMQNQNGGNTGTFNTRFRGRYGEVQSAWSYQKNNRQWMYGVTGGVAIHGEGVTFSQEINLDGANALIDTAGAGGININNGTGITTDWRGYTIVPNLIPYQENALSLDVNSVDAYSEIHNSDLTVIPSRGALVSAKFNVSKGRKALIKLTRIDGTLVPFGSIVSVESAKTIPGSNGIVADNGQVWMSGLPDSGVLNVRWGDTDNSGCKAPFNIGEEFSGILRLSVKCH
ncbi:Putative type 1 fimbriae anchoring protein FimD [Escherichia coli]|nr:Putative type 1 fimbriae anchoring protein FimD [Escherichia coli]CAD5881769.1 Putative type 1 fimbriae anchoring protein FimD [Escherichia coli]CAD6120958.1 Putative type 1 fimbriae anchoring protein FimD [Escherichia coli]